MRLTPFSTSASFMLACSTILVLVVVVTGCCCHFIFTCANCVCLTVNCCLKLAYKLKALIAKKQTEIVKNIGIAIRMGSNKFYIP